MTAARPEPRPVRGESGSAGSADRVSVIVPALNEAERVGDVLRAAREAFGPHAELLLVDGGSEDGTPARAAGLARVLSSPPGRGTQQAAGARAARGDVLVFLHADTLVAPEAGRRILECLRDPAVVGGCCRFALHPPAPSLPYRLLEAAVNLRPRLFRTATGDQVIFARRQALAEAGGVPEQPLFEDVELARALRRQGRFRIVPAVARTSRRRWDRRGFWRTVALHWALRAAYGAGVPAERLARIYERRARARALSRMRPAEQAVGSPGPGPAHRAGS